MAQNISFNYHSVFFKLLIDGGYISFGVGGTPVYHFYQKDHLGNVRVVSDANGTVEEVNHYYPYGALMGESQNTTTQPYKYNGKELDRSFGLDWYDYGARWLDGVGGRWSSIDPLCEKYFDVSPYTYCAGNPVNRVDPDGRDYRLIFDHENQTITIYANYFVQKDAEEAFSKAKDFWNTKSFKIQDYTVKFNITDEADENGGYLNTFTIDFSSENKTDYTITGNTENGNKIILYDGLYNDATAMHEMGHTLGLIHYPEDSPNAMSNIMYFNAYERGQEVTSEQIKNIIYYGSKKNPEYDYNINGEKVEVGACVPRTQYGLNRKKNLKILNRLNL